MKKNIINPIGLKGNQIDDRIKELMNIVSPITENTSKVVIELTKMGPDGNAYAIIRENHEHYIKIATNLKDKTKLVSEDFKYIGGLMNKKSEAYPSYAKAIKHLNIKFQSLAEHYGFDNAINVFENDNLLTEAGFAGFANMNGSGFSGHGNLEGNKPLHEDEKAKNNPWAICTASVGREDKDKYESCVKDVKKEKGIDENMQECDYDKMTESEEVQLTETEQAIQNMMNKTDDSKTHSQTPKYSIARAITEMENIIDDLEAGNLKKKVYRLK